MDRPLILMALALQPVVKLKVEIVKQDFPYVRIITAIVIKLKRYSIAGLIQKGFKRIEKRYDITTFQRLLNFPIY
jgi:hypothetical protein